MHIECSFKAVQYRCGCIASYSSMLHHFSHAQKVYKPQIITYTYSEKHSNTACGKICWHHNIQEM